MPRCDLLIRNGLVIDGTGAAGYHAGIAISDGRITEMGQGLSSASAREVIDADGHIVTPGWIDPHTHFDGQATWDDRLDPAFGHGTTTAIMGNCGVGFAPVKPGTEQDLIDIMEGVEDIPFDTLHEAIPWGEWRSYPEYLTYLRNREFGLDVGAQIPHGPMRAYVMGPGQIYRKDATPEQIETMGALLHEAIEAGALGMSTSRVVGHRAMNAGESVPGTFASEEELTALSCVMGKLGKGVLQMIPGGCLGTFGGTSVDARTTREEVLMMGRISRASGRPITFSTFQHADDPQEWRFVLEQSDKENSSGSRLHPQVAARPPGILMSLEGYHPLMRRETYLKLRHLPMPERIREMRKPEVKAAILSDKDIPHEKPGSPENFLSQYTLQVVGEFVPLGAEVNYEPDENQLLAGLAKAAGDSEQSVLYDLLLEHEGTNALLMTSTNYVDHNLDAVYEMFMHPSTVSGLGDAGAHGKFICDASFSTFVLSHFVRDRTRGPRMPLETAVVKLTSQTADLYGLSDRGRLRPGLRADINVIDPDAIRLDLPRMHHDLPLGADRLLQKAHGYRATLVNGVATRLHDEDTGARPGRLI